MTKKFFNDDINYFPSINGNNEQLLDLLTKTSVLLCEWFSDTNKRSPLPLNNKFKVTYPQNSGSDVNNLLDEIKELIYTSFCPSHPGSLANLDPPPLSISIIGDLIASGLNNNLLAEELSPSISKLENDICEWLCRKIGFSEDSGGIAASGGTLNNLNALVTAKYCSDLTFNNEAVLIISEDAHVSFKKCAKILGIENKNIYLVKTDENGSMHFPSFKKLVNYLMGSGRKIFAVVATFGTTIRGALDPLNEIGHICKEKKIWFHIDASIGGVFLIANNKFKNINDFNFNNANSVTINPQKLIGITKTSSLLLVSDIKTLQNTFNTGLPYIYSPDDVINRGELGIQGSRAPEIIKLWLGFRFLGIEGIEKILEESILKKSIFIEKLDENKFEIYSGPLHIVLFLPKNMNDEESNNWTLKAKNLLLEKNYMISRPFYKGKYYLRVVFGNFNTKALHILELSNFLNNFNI
tara:strand:+ start:72 stop:1472 length:1401 start_codon:yes stop_codon:yes gene_type:complete